MLGKFSANEGKHYSIKILKTHHLPHKCPFHRKYLIFLESKLSILEADRLAKTATKLHPSRRPLPETIRKWRETVPVDIGAPSRCHLAGLWLEFGHNSRAKTENRERRDFRTRNFDARNAKTTETRTSGCARASVFDYTISRFETFTNPTHPSLVMGVN